MLKVSDTKSTLKEIHPREIFEKLDNNDVASISRASKEKFRVIQRKIILNQVDELLHTVREVTVKSK